MAKHSPEQEILGIMCKNFEGKKGEHIFESSEGIIKFISKEGGNIEFSIEKYPICQLNDKEFYKKVIEEMRNKLN